MSQAIHITVDNAVRATTDIHMTVDNAVRRVVAGHITVDNALRQFWGAPYAQFVAGLSGEDTGIITIHDIYAGVTDEGWRFYVYATSTEDTDECRAYARARLRNIDCAGKTLTITYKASGYQGYCDNMVGFIDENDELMSYELLYNFSDYTTKTITVPDGTALVVIGSSCGAEGTNEMELCVKSLTVGDYTFL